MSKNSSIKLTKKASNSQKTQTTELARQVTASTGRWRAKTGTLLHFLTSVVAEHQKTKGGPLVKKNSKKSLTLSKQQKGGTL